MSQYLGDISAYALAVSQGYTGTEEEYAELMASYATVGQTAVNAAQTATTKASEAATSATTATTKASEATTAATTATNKAAEAQADADAAALDASQALSAASTATSKASEATTAAATATSAKTDAVAANTAAQSAKTAAQTAQAGAETAAASVQSSAAQIQTNADDISELKEDLTAKADVSELLKAFPVDTASGAIASFTDGAELPLKSLTVDIEPIQDLHGYDNPWPAGGGKNKFFISASRNAYSWSDGCGFAAIAAGDSSITFNGTASAPHAFAVSGAALTLPAGTYTVSMSVPGKIQFVLKKSGTQDVIANITDNAAQFTLTEETTMDLQFTIQTGASFSNQAIGFQIEAGSTATAYAPYENICPISGWSEVNVQRTGKNLIELSPTTQTVNGVTFTVNDDGTISLSGTATQNTNYFLSSGERSFINGSFVLSGCPSGGNASTYYLRIDNATGGFLAADYGDGRQFTISDGKIYTVFINVKSGVNTNGLVFKPMIELGTTATTYEPYIGQSINIQLGQTVYGGKLDVVSGELSVDNICINPSEFTISRVSGNGTITTVLISGITQGKELTAISNRFSEYIPSDTAGRMAQLATEIYVILLTADLSSDTNEGVRAWFSNNPTQICYELATPLTIQLTPHEVRSLLGSNNVWADTGDSTVEYRADPTLYIGRLTEPDADMVADANITSGQYFMVGNTLYKATANIASGATISPNVNCTRKSLSEALNELNA